MWFKAELEKNSNLKVVISDIRFLNEADCIKKLSGSIIKINRYSTHTDQHQSETELIQIKSDFVLDNNESIDMLYADIDAILKKI